MNGVGTRERLGQEQERARVVFEEVRKELLQLPHVVRVGVGLKETGGELTDQLAFRVYVDEKIDEAQLRPEERVPDTVRGFRTDVIRDYGKELIIGFGDEDDWKKYSPKLGGIRIGNDQTGGGTGTLGCLARRNAVGTVVMLSNHHVLLSGGAAVGAKVGQPDHDSSCCCTSNEIGEVVDADEPLDCAIATLKPEFAFMRKIRRIRRADGTTEEAGIIRGSSVAIATDVVWKIGARTGLTRGTVTETIPELTIEPNAPFVRVCNRGDSGSVVVDAAGDVVGLLYAMDGATNTLGFAKEIGPVLARLDITLMLTDVTEEDVAEFDDADAALAALDGTAFAGVGERLMAAPGGEEVLQLFELHRGECLHLVNEVRAVTIAWHRSRGPTWLAALGRSAKEPAYRVPEKIESIARDEAARRILQALMAHGSPALCSALEEHSSALLGAFAESETLDDFLRSLRRAPVPAPG